MNEATLQAELYHSLRLEGLHHTEVACEYRLPGLRADLALLHPRTGEPICLVEVKQSRRDRTMTRQHARYEASGVPWRYCEGRWDMASTLAWCLDRWARRVP